jgi:general secretion pathway protein K
MTTPLRKLAKRPTDQGFALIVVLGMCVVLAALGAGFAQSVRGNLRTTALSIDTAKARAMADAGIVLAQLDLEAARGGRPNRRRFPIDGTAIACRFSEDGGVLTVLVEDEGGKVNLNSANAELLASFLAGIGVAPQDARAFTERRGDSRLNVVDELDQFTPLTPDMKSSARRLATVHSASAGVDEASASARLAAVLQAGQQKLRGQDTLESPGGNIPRQFQSRTAGQVYTIRSLGRLPNGASVVTEAIIEVAGPTRQPTVIKQSRVGELDALDDGLLRAGAPEAPC